MAVDRAVSRAHMLSELAAVRQLGEQYGWQLTVDETEPRFEVTLTAHNGDIFLVEVACDDYRELPPHFEFLEHDTRKRGTPRAYPFKDGGDSFFHSNLCICAPFNRKAYKKVFANGPHDDWPLGAEWATSKANGYDWSNLSHLGDMLGAIQTRLARPSHYNRRMG